MLKGIIPYTHHLLKTSIKEGDIVIDATCGNGNDTLLLASIVGETGHVYAFDIQEQAITTTKALLAEHNYKHVTYIQDSHANLNTYVPIEQKGKIGGVVFNLGYLPRSDKQIITTSESTIPAIKIALDYVEKGHLVILVIYYGHEGGTAEKDAVLSFTKNLDQKQYNVLQYQFINQKNHPPFIIAIEKR